MKLASCYVCSCDLQCFTISPSIILFAVTQLLFQMVMVPNGQVKAFACLHNIFKRFKVQERWLVTSSRLGKKRIKA